MVRNSMRGTMTETEAKQFDESTPPLSGAPFKGYVFKHDGKYDPREVVKLLTPEDAARWAVGQAAIIQSGIEVIITDRDDYAIFHAVDGKIIFPRQAEAIQERHERLPAIS